MRFKLLLAGILFVGLSLSSCGKKAPIASMETDLEATPSVAAKRALGATQKKSINYVARLGLSDEQKAQFQALRKTKAEQTKAVREAVKNGTMTKEEATAEVAKIKAAFEAGLGDVFTAEQLATYKDLQAKQQARAQKQKKQQKNSPFRGLKLTQEQQTQVKELAKTQSAQIKALREAVKNGVTTKEDAKTERTKIKTDFETGLSAVLSAEQLEKYTKAKARLAKQKAREKKKQAGKRKASGSKG